MPRIKLLRFYSNEGYNSDEIKCYEASNWHEVTEEELSHLTSYDGTHMLMNKHKEFSYVIVEEVEYPELLSQLIEEAKNYKELRIEKERKQKEVEAAERAREEQKQIEKAKKFLIEKGLKVE